MKEDCIFCKIVKGQMNADIIYRDEGIIAFPDIDPKAPVHILIIPQKHIEKISDIDTTNSDIVKKMVLVANNIAEDKNLLAEGYRLVFNCGENGGQAVFHIHLHLLGGRKLNWPPG